jgi:hypothetical protein
MNSLKKVGFARAVGAGQESAVKGKFNGELRVISEISALEFYKGHGHRIYRLLDFYFNQ